MLTDERATFQEKKRSCNTYIVRSNEEHQSEIPVSKMLPPQNNDAEADKQVSKAIPQSC